jgi:hypothetical protein
LNSKNEAANEIPVAGTSFADALSQGEIVAKTLQRLEIEDFSREALLEVIELAWVIGNITDEESAELQRVLTEGVKTLPVVSFINNRAIGGWEHCEPPPRLQPRSWKAWATAVYCDARHRYFNKGKWASTRKLAGIAGVSRRNINRWRNESDSKEFFEYYEAQIDGTTENERMYWDEILRVREERKRESS